jgi:HEAT repeat protein
MSNLKEYVEKLDCSDEAERIYAAEDIGYLNDPNGVPVLLERLGREPSRQVRDVIFQALIRIDADSAIEACIGLFGSDDPQTRNQAVDVLRHKAARSIPLLKTAMRDGDKHARKLVLDVLSGIPVEDSDEIYDAALSDDDLNVVITAVENLGRIRAKGFRCRIEDLLEAGSHPMLTAACLDALVGIGHETSLASIRRRFPDFSTLPDFLLASCLRAIAALGSQLEFAEVASLLFARGPHLRPAILGALIAIHERTQPGAIVAAGQRCELSDAGERLLPALQAVVANGDPALCRYQAVRALGFWTTRDDVFEVLVSCLSHPERLVRLGAIESLRLTERPGIGQILAARALNETDAEVLEALSC